MAFLGLTLLAVPAVVNAGTEPRDLFDMSLEDLLEVNVVSAARHEQRIIDSPRSIAVITAQDILRNNWRTVPEALNEVAGVFVQETNYGGGSPIIRGMIGNRVLILVDGIRINNATYRLGPNQYLNTVDINQVERIEVLRGTRSVLYGSDAFGGLINIITRSRESAGGPAALSARVFGRYASADDGLASRLEMSGASGRLAFLGGISLKGFGDLRAGGETGPQSYTGYEETDGDFNLHWRLPARQKLALGMQRVHQTDVRRTDKLTAAGSNLKYEWNPQQRDLVYVDYLNEQVGSFINSLEIKISRQGQLEDWIEITKKRPGIESAYHTDVHTNGLLTQLSSSARRHLFTYGIEYSGDQVESGRLDTDLATGEQTRGSGTVADGASYHSLAAFVQDEYSPTDQLSLNLGLRFSRFWMDATMESPDLGGMTLRSRIQALTGTAFASYRIREDLSVVLGAGQGFRAPNIDDTTVLGSFSGGFEVPNPGLKPEDAITYELGMKTQGPRASGTIAAFHTRVHDLIDRGPGTFEGLSFIDTNGNGLRDDGEAAVFQRLNLGRGRINGVEAEARVQVERRWDVFCATTWTLGVDEAAGEPLTRIPPIHGAVGARCTPSAGRWLEAYSAYAFGQNRLSPSDKKDPRIDPSGTPGYLTFNVRGGLDLHRLGTITLGLENLTDKTYRQHGSGIDAPGRNLILGFQKTF